MITGNDFGYERWLVMATCSTGAGAACFTVGLSAAVLSIEVALSGGSMHFPSVLSIGVAVSGGAGVAVGLVAFRRAMSWMPGLLFGALFGLLVAAVTMVVVVLFYSDLTSGRIHEWTFPAVVAVATFAGAYLVALLGQKATAGLAR